jgi:hypothetical protein
LPLWSPAASPGTIHRVSREKEVTVPVLVEEGRRLPAGESRGGGPNTGFQDALGVLVRLLQRGRLPREELEEVVRGNCSRLGRPAPVGGSMQRRLERLRATFEESGVALEPLAGGDAGRSCGWQMARRSHAAARGRSVAWPS